MNDFYYIRMHIKMKVLRIAGQKRETSCSETFFPAFPFSESKYNVQSDGTQHLDLLTRAGK